jgi:hypothetical protein
MLSPITVTNFRVEERDRQEQSRKRPQKRKKDRPQLHEENRGDRIDLTA